VPTDSRPETPQMCQIKVLTATAKGKQATHISFITTFGTVSRHLSKVHMHTMLHEVPDAKPQAASHQETDNWCSHEYTMMHNNCFCMLFNLHACPTLEESCLVCIPLPACKPKHCQYYSCVPAALSNRRLGTPQHTTSSSHITHKDCMTPPAAHPRS
jgi:hypothetical protein